MSITLDLPSEMETLLQEKAQSEGLTMPDFLLRLVRRETENSLYAPVEIREFLDADTLSPEIAAKVQRMLGR